MTARRGSLLPAALALGGLLALAVVTAALASRGRDPAIGVVLFAGAGVALLLLGDPRAATIVALGGYIVAEGQKDWGIPGLWHLYDATPARLSAAELLLLLAVASVCLDVVRRGEALRMPAPFKVALALAFAAALAGLVNGLLSWAPGFAIKTFIQSMAPLFLVPWVIVNVVRTPEQLRNALGLAGAAAVLKAVLGLVVVALGTGPLLPDGSHLTYYEPTANFVILVALLAVVGGVLARAALPRWLIWGAPLLAASLVLSYRRTFWIAAVLALLVTALAASGRLGRRLAVPLAVASIAVGALVAQSGVFSDLQGPLVQRAASIDPAKIKLNEQDRYRLDERRNVLASLRDSPVVGLGAGVPWEGRYPLPFEYRYNRFYVHMAGLWWWMTMGLLGVLSYVVLMVSAVLAGAAVWRRHPDRRIRVFGLAAATGTLALSVVELTSTVLGPDQRPMSIFAAMLGLLAVAHASARPAGAPAPDGSLGTA